MKDLDAKRIIELLEVIVKIKLKDSIRDNLSDPVIYKVYELTGKMNTKEISKKVNISTGKVSLIWQELEKSGLLIKEGRTYKKVI